LWRLFDAQAHVSNLGTADQTKVDASYSKISPQCSFSCVKHARRSAESCASPNSQRAVIWPVPLTGSRKLSVSRYEACLGEQGREKDEAGPQEASAGKSRRRRAEQMHGISLASLLQRARTREPARLSRLFSALSARERLASRRSWRRDPRKS